MADPPAHLPLVPRAAGVGKGSLRATRPAAPGGVRQTAGPDRSGREQTEGPRVVCRPVLRLARPYQFRARAAPAESPVMTATVLFVCTANNYRSRFAEHLFNHLAAP